MVNLLYDPERRIEVEWDKVPGGEAANYTVKLTMEVEDRKGVLAAVSAKITDINTNIRNMEARTGGDDQRARIDVTVEIADLQHLQRVINALKMNVVPTQGMDARKLPRDTGAALVAVNELVKGSHEQTPEQASAWVKLVDLGVVDALAYIVVNGTLFGVVTEPGVPEHVVERVRSGVCYRVYMS